MNILGQGLFNDLSRIFRTRVLVEIFLDVCASQLHLQVVGDTVVKRGLKSKMSVEVYFEGLDLSIIFISSILKYTVLKY